MSKKNIAISILLALTLDTSLLAMSCCSFNPTASTTITAPKTALQFAPNGCLLTGDSLGNITSYSPTGSCSYDTTPTYTDNTGSPVNDLTISPNGCLAVASTNSVSVYAPSGSCTSCSFISSSTQPTTSTTTIAFGVNGCLAVGDNIGNITIYAPITIGSCDYDLTTSQTLNAGTGAGISAIAFSPVNNCLVVGDISGAVTIYTQNSGCTYVSTSTQTITLPEAINDISFSTNGCFAVSDNSNEVTIYQSGLGCNYTLTTTITGITSPSVAAFSPTNTCLVVGDSVGNLNVYNQMNACTYTTTALPVRPPTGMAINLIAFSANGCLATASDSAVTVYAPNTSLGVTVNPLSNSICSGSTATFIATATGGTGVYTYTWLAPDNTQIQTGSSNTLTLANTTQSDDGLYTVILTDGSGCQATAVFFLNITTILAVLSVSPDALCNGGQATLKATIDDGIAPYTVNIYANNTLLQTITGIMNDTVMYPVTPLVNTNYYVTITDSSIPTSCSGASNTVTVSVDTVTAPVILGTTTTCDATIVITGRANLGDTIEVFNGTTQIAVPVIASVTDGSFIITTISLPAGIYSSLEIVATDGTSCSASALVPAVTVNPLLGVTINVPSTLVCAGTTLTLTAAATGGLPPYLNYSWTGPNFSQSGDSDTATIMNISEANEGIYSVTVTDNFGCTASASVFIQVVSVGVALAVSPSFLCNGVGESTLTGSIALGAPPYSAQIYANNVLFDTLTDITTKTFTAMVMPTVTTSYITIVTDADGCMATSNPVVVTVSQVNVLAINKTTVNCNGTATFVVMSDIGNEIAIFNETLGIQVGGPSLVPSSGIVTITTSAVTANGLYNFSAVATNPFGCKATANANNLQVNAPVKATVTPSSQTICPGGTGTLTATASGGTGVGTYTYNWSGPDNYTATGNVATIMPTGSINSGTYTVTVTDQNGCQATASASILVTAVTLSALGTVCSATAPVLTIAVADTHPNYTTKIYINNALHTTVVSTTSTFTYTPPAITAATSYYVIVTDAVGCTVQSNTVTITASTVNLPTNLIASANCNGSVTITGNATAGNTITVLLNGVNVSIPIIVGSSGAFSVTTEPLTPGSGIVLTVTSTNATCCQASSNLAVTVPSLLTLSLSAPSVCNGQTLTITPTVTGGSGNYSYSWTGPNAFSSTTALVSIPNATLTNAGIYTLVVTDTTTLCTVTNSIFAQVTNVAITLSPNPSSVCEGDISILTANVIGGKAPFVVQFSGSTPLPPSSNTVYDQIVSPTLTNNSFTATVTDSNGCSSTSNVVVFDLAAVTAPVITSIFVNCLSQVVITGTATQGNSITVSENGTNISVPVTVDALNNFSLTTETLIPGSYTLTVTASNAYCCSASSPIDIVVPDPLMVTISPAVQIVCMQDSLQFTATAMGGTDPYTYNWTSSNGFSQNTGTIPTLTVSNLTLNSQGDYFVTVSDSRDCQYTSAKSSVAINACTDCPCP